jgi:cell division protein ZapA (FtsZ GTPase activity inhibitor)
VTLAKINIISYSIRIKVLYMTTDELAELRERVSRLESRMDETSKKLDSVSKYLRELYEYLQKQQGRPLL